MNTANAPNDEEVVVKKIGNRHVQMLFLFAAFCICMVTRTNLSIAIVAMTSNDTSSNPDVPTYEWDDEGLVLGAFFYTYMCFQIPAAFIAKLSSAKHLLLWSLFLNTVAFTLIPVIADVGGSYGVIALRLIQGFGQGVLLPCTQTILGRWSPPSERSTIGGIVFTGISVGSVLAFFTTGFICSSSFGWPLTFYLWGAVGLAWCISYFFFGFDSPANHPRLKIEERDHIQRSLNQTAEDKEPKIPLKKILLCVPFWATVFANSGNNYAYTSMMTQVSIYLAKVMKFEMSSNGVVSACPYIGATLMGWIYSPLSDVLIQKKILKRVNARRLFQITGSYGMGIFLIIVGYLSYSQFLAVFFLTVANMFYASTLCAYSLSQMDLSPRFCGIMYGFSNTIGFIIATISPTLLQFIVTDQENRQQWQTMFIITGVVYMFSATVYAIFISAERQPWDSVEEVPEVAATTRK